MTVVVDLAYYRQSQVCLSPADAAPRLAGLARAKAASMAKASTTADRQVAALASQGVQCRVSDSVAVRLKGLAAAADVRARMASLGCGGR